MIATKENRSVANVMENAVRVFTLFPKELRDALVETSSDETRAAARFREISRLILYNAARDKFVAATQKLSESGEVDQDMLLDDEAVVIENRL